MKEQSLFIAFMGDAPVIRILDFLLTERGLDFSITDLARNASIGRTTLYRVFDQLLRLHVIAPTRIIGKAKLYKLNTQNVVVQKLIEIDDLLMMQDLQKRISKEKISLHV